MNVMGLNPTKANFFWYCFLVKTPVIIIFLIQEMLHEYDVEVFPFQFRFQLLKVIEAHGFESYLCVNFVDFLMALNIANT